MKIIEKKVYYCDHCGKYHSLSAGVTSRHEKYCTSNPNNWHACFHYCKYLVKTDIPMVIGGDLDGPDIITPKRTEFTCSLLNKKLYSFRAEKKGLVKNGYVNDAERMPLKCDSYEIEEGMNPEMYL